MIIKKKISKREQLEALGNGHSRREFLQNMRNYSTGLVVMPSLLTVASRSVYAEDCLSGGLQNGNSRARYFELHAGGGYPMNQDVAIPGESGSLITNGSRYENFGWSNSADFNALGTVDLGGAPFHPHSPFRAGLLFGIGGLSAPNQADLLDRIGITYKPAKSNSDSASNRSSGVGYASYMTPEFNYKFLVGNNSGSASGGRHELPTDSIGPLAVPAIVRNNEDAQRLAGKGDIFNDKSTSGTQGLGAENAELVLKAFSSMSASKVAAFSKLSLDEQKRTLIDCNIIKAERIPLEADPAALEPTTNANVNSIFDGVTDATSGNSRRTNTSDLAAIAFLVMQGHANVGVHTQGGYDSHNDTATTTWSRGFRLGLKAGQVLALAYLEDKKLFLRIVSDGAMGVSRMSGSGVLLTETFDRDIGGVSTSIEGALRPGDSDSMQAEIHIALDKSRVTNDIVNGSGLALCTGYSNDRGGQAASAVTVDDRRLQAMHAVYNWLTLDGRPEDIMKIPGLRSNPFEDSIYKKYKIG